MSASTRMDPLVGQVVGDKYEVIRLIGKGGMGAVYEVRHRELGSSFALKKLNPDLLDDAESLTRFRREAQVVARFRHPGIVGVSDWENLEDGSPCIIMELLTGEDLGTRLKRGGLQWPMLASVADQVLSALAVAHRGGIVHRDLKPQNIFLARDDTGEERAKILDFGLSKVRGGGVTTTSERLLGTPSYMSPEQADGQAATLGPETDVWAMGAILAEMATGKQAFSAPSIPAVLYRICFGQPEPLTILRPDAPAAFVDLVGRALSRDPAWRLRAVDELRAGLRAALAGVAAGAVPELVPAGGSGQVASAPPASAPRGSVPRASVPRGSVPDMSVPSGSLLAAEWEGPTAAFPADPSLQDAPPRSKLPLVLVAAAAGLVAAVAVALVAVRPGSKPPPPPAPVVAAPVDAAPAPARTAPPRRTVTVLVNSTPVADVFRGLEERGQTPLNVPVTVGEPMALRLVAQGYRPFDLTLDGSSTRVDVKLEKLPGRGTVAARPPRVDAKAPPTPPPQKAPVVARPPAKAPAKAFKLEAKPLDIK
ncbi:MAG: serine/threonine protein kinase [Deltaproteobacteria bacterium]|nr:serine/threonine protein kinase [Deltaproteobacteria bacterium]